MAVHVWADDMSETVSMGGRFFLYGGWQSVHGFLSCGRIFLDFGDQGIDEIGSLVVSKQALEQKEDELQACKEGMKQKEDELQAAQADLCVLRENIEGLVTKLREKEMDVRHLRDEKADLVHQLRDENADLVARLEAKEKFMQEFRDTRAEQETKMAAQESQRESVVIRTLVVPLFIFNVVLVICVICISVIMIWPTAIVADFSHCSEGQPGKEYAEAWDDMTRTPTTIADFAVRGNKAKREWKRRQQTMRETSAFNENNMKAYEMRQQIAKLWSMIGEIEGDTASSADIPELL